jgi:tetratricopeptide (TPR) repeat protein
VRGGRLVIATATVAVAYAAAGAEPVRRCVERATSTATSTATATATPTATNPSPRPSPLTGEREMKGAPTSTTKSPAPSAADRRRAIAAAYDAKLEALEALDRKERAEAIALLEKFVARHASDPAYTPAAMLRLSELYYERASDEHAAAHAAWRDEVAKGAAAGREPPPEPVKNYAKAIALYQRLLTGFPRFEHLHTVQYLLAYCLGEMGQAEEARAAYAALVERYPQSPFLPEALVRLGDAAFDDARPGSLDRAVEAYTKALSWPEHRLYTWALYKLGWTLYRADRHAEAVDAFTRLLDHDVAAGARGDTWPEAVQYVAVSFADPEWGGVEKARAFFASRGGRPYEGEIYLRLGDVLSDQARNLDAVSAYRLALAKDPLAATAPGTAEKIVAVLGRERRFDDEAREREALAETYREGSDWWARHGGDPALAAEARGLVRRSLSAAAAHHHQQAQLHEQAGSAARAAEAYAAAARDYGAYLARFPAAADGYEERYRFADALYHAGDLPSAAKAYGEVRDDPSDRRHEAEAALSAVQAWQRALAEAERTGAVAKRPVLTSKERSAPPGAAAPLEPLADGLVRDSDAFVARLPSHEKAAAIAYKAAEVFYAHDDLAEARCRLEEVAARWPASEVAPYAANLIIESELAVKDWAAVEATSARLAASAVGKDAKLAEALQGWKLGGRFNRALELMEAKRHDEAAALFASLVAEDPRHPFADKALYNAAACHEAARRFDSALRLQERLYAEYPDSAFADEALFRVAWNAENSYDFEKAVERYLLLVERYPRSARRKDALFDAARSLENLQRYDEAARAFARYAELYPDAEDAPRAQFHAALVYEKARAWQREVEALSALGRGPGRAAPPDLLVQAHLRRALASRELGDERAARSGFDAAVAEFARSQLDPDAAPAAAAAAAEARFRLAEYEFERFDAVKLPATATPKRLKAALEAKLSELKRVAPAYDAVKRYRRPEWTLAAFYRQAFLLERLAQALYQAPVPPELQRPGQEEYLAAYQDQLAHFAQPYEDQAVQVYVQAAKAARELHVKNAWTRKIAESLARYRPREHPLLKEPKGMAMASDLSPGSLDEHADLSAVGPLPAPAGGASPWPPLADALAPVPLDPALGPAARARALFATGVERARALEHAAAADAFEAALALEPSLSFAAYDAGVEREAAGEGARALADYGAVSQGHPAQPLARRNLTRLLVRLGRADEAVVALAAAADRAPRDAAPRAALAEVLAAAGRFDAAEREARRALALDERLVPAMTALAGAYHGRGRHELALAVLENARQIDPRDAAVWNRLGFVLAALGQRTPALEAWRTAAELAPGYAEALVNHGAALVEAEDHAAAAPPLEAATRAAPGAKEAWLDLGNAYRGLGRFEDAERAYARALELDPALADAELDLALLHLDGEKPGLAAPDRLAAALAHLDAYAARGGADLRLAGWRKDASALLEKERRRVAREEKDRLRRDVEASRKEPR